MVRKFPFRSKASARRPSLENRRLEYCHHCSVEKCSTSPRSLTAQRFGPVLRLRFANFNLPSPVTNNAVLLTEEYAAQQYLLLYSFSVKVMGCILEDLMSLMISGVELFASATINKEVESKELPSVIKTRREH